MGAATRATHVFAVRADHGAGGASVPVDAVTAWIVSPHLLVAQAVGAALRAAGAQVEVRPWSTLAQDVVADGARPGVRRVVAIFDDPDGPEVALEVQRVIRSGGVHVAAIVPGPALEWWGGLLDTSAFDVVARTTSVGQLLEVLEKMAAGEPLMDAESRLAVRAAWVEVLDGHRRTVSLVASLSPQQRRVLELLAAGHRVREVAVMMGVTVGTVRSHVKALRAKLGARTQLEAVAMLRRADEVPELGDEGPAPSAESAPVLPHPRRPLSGPDARAPR